MMYVSRSVQNSLTEERDQDGTKLGNPIEHKRIIWTTALPQILTTNKHITQQAE
jgi:hypothetical protein